MLSDNVSEGIKAAGAAGVIATTVAGITLQDWAALAALIWTLWLLADKAIAKYRHWRMLREIRLGDRARRNGGE